MLHGADVHSRTRHVSKPAMTIEAIEACTECSRRTDEGQLIRELRKSSWGRRYLRRILSSWLAGPKRRASGEEARGHETPCAYGQARSEKRKREGAEWNKGQRRRQGRIMKD